MTAWLGYLLFVIAAFGCAFALFRMRQMQTQVQASAEELKRLQASQSQVMHTTKLASLGQMVAGVTHEINTPLGFLRSNAQVVTELLDEHTQVLSKISDALQKIAAFNAADPKFQAALPGALLKIRQALANDQRLSESRELLTDALEGVDQISKLVKNLKGFARVDRDGQDLWSVNEGIESALTIAQHQLRDRIEVIKNLSAVPLVRVVPSQINQVFLNLITNASQAIVDRGTLTVTSRRNGDHVEVEFTDSGAGIPADVLPKIFDPFFTTKPVGEGTGLGLSIVHKILTGYGGNITVSSALGHGASFVVSLPIDYASLKSHGVSHAEATQP
jgi:two-component system, NtrC family, sensor kinase